MIEMPERIATMDENFERPVPLIDGPRGGRMIMVPDRVKNISVAVMVDRCEHAGFATHEIKYNRETTPNGDVFKCEMPYDELRYTCAKCVGIHQAERARMLTWQWRVEKWWNAKVRSYNSSIGFRMSHLRSALGPRRRYYDDY